MAWEDLEKMERLFNAAKRNESKQDQSSWAQINAARELWALYTAMLAEGFTDKQALYLTGKFIISGGEK